MHLSGILQSLQQAITGRKAAFCRTPKIATRTAALVRRESEAQHQQEAAQAKLIWRAIHPVLRIAERTAPRLLKRIRRYTPWRVRNRHRRLQEKLHQYQQCGWLDDIHSQWRAYLHSLSDEGISIEQIVIEPQVAGQQGWRHAPNQAIATAIMISDSDIKRDVEDELKWDPELDATDIAVSVTNGVVTLIGFTRSYIDKHEAELAAKRVAGVLAVANDIAVRLPSSDERPDPEVARDAVAAIKSQLPISYENIKVVVKDGWATLEGHAEWQYQRQTAENAVRRLKGVKGVSNFIQLKPRVEPSEVKRKIQEAFRRSAELDANRITVEANGGEVVLKGSVRSWIERAEAERAAWAAPGIVKVDDRLVVSP